MTVYLDESGTHLSSPAIVIAGWLAPDEQWERFSENWNELLRRYNLTLFHMNQFESRRKQFASLNNGERRNLMFSLVKLISIRTSQGIACVINKKDYNEEVPAELSSEVGGPYFLCANLCLESIREWAEGRSHTDPINFAFEKGAEYGGQVREAFERVKKKRPDFAQKYRIGEVAFLEKRSAPVQAADLLAYEVWKDYCNDLSGKPRRQRWPLGEMPNVPIALTTLDRPELRRRVDRVAQRSAIVPKPTSGVQAASKSNNSTP